MKLVCHRSAITISSVLATTLCVAGLYGCGSSGQAIAPKPTPITVLTPLPGATLQPPPTVDPSSQGNPVPAPTGTDLVNILAGGTALMQYVQALASSAPLPPPPTGSMVVGGTIQSISGATFVIATHVPTSNPAPYFTSTNVGVPATLTITITNQTFVDSRRGIADLASGTPVIVGGTFSSANALAASQIVPITSVTIAQGKARRQHSLRRIAPSFDSTTPTLVSRPEPPNGTASLASTRANASVTFSQQAGIPGINVSDSASFDLGLCTTVTAGVTVVLGIGASYTWPVVVTATEAAPITVGTTGSLSLLAAGSPPPETSPNLQYGFGATIDITTSLSNACLFNLNINGPSDQFGEAFAINASIPAVLANAPIVLCSPTLVSNGSHGTCTGLSPPEYANVECIEVDVPGLPEAVGLNLCPRITLQSGMLTFNSFSEAGALLITPPGPLEPQSALLIEPTGPATYQLQANGPEYSYTAQSAMDLQLVALEQALLDWTFFGNRQQFTPPANVS